MRSWLWFLVLVLLLASVGYFFFTSVSPRPFAYDESDYMYAGSRGAVANYLDQPSQSLAEFVRMGLDLKSNPNLRQSSSQYIRSLGDVAFYRHYHGPVYAMWLAWMHSFGVTSETGFRGFNEVEIFSHRLWAGDQDEFLGNIVRAYREHV